MQLFDLLSAFNSWRTFGRPDLSASNRSWWNRYPSPTNTTEAPTENSAPSKSDQYVPSKKPVPEATVPAKSTDQPAVTKQPDGTYYYRREARLDYQLDLRFDLAAVTRSVSRLAEGDTSQVESLIAAGFGLSADFSASGYQRVDTNIADGQGGTDVARIEKELAKNRTSLAVAERFAQQDRAYALQGFYRQASTIRRSLNESVQDGHRRATNKIALRFQMDSRFSFALAERFNIQTQQVATQTPNSLSGYLESAGRVADNGAAELMAGFFDAVDSYLANSESQIRAQTDQFFAMAADELGFDGALVSVARDQLLGSIDSFFSRVESALGTLRSFYSPGGIDVEPGAQSIAGAVPADVPSRFQSELAVA